MTATAVTSVSVDPPSLLVCVNRTGRLHEMLSATERFCVNVLHAEHAEVSRIFAQPHSDQRFACGDWEDDAGSNLPYLRGAQAVLFCRKAMTVPYASHSIIIGEVEDVRIRDDIAPLIYQDGLYGIHGPLQPC
jgi:flavin reductase (DIM6/NTAB) family NADH-FMN oxidoreductase RutF